MKPILSLLLIIMFASAFSVDKEKKYKATIVTALGTFNGELKLDLHGSNEGEIEIKTLNEKGETGGIKINAKFIEQVKIDTTTYYMEDLNDKGYDNRNRYLVTKIYGDDTLGVYSLDTEKGNEYYVGQANTEYLRNINHEKFNGKGSYFTISDYFASCKILFTKIESAQEGYYTTAAMSIEERLAFWKKAIDEYAQCK